MTHTATTRLLAVIGNPIEHSMSPLIHGEALKDRNIDFAYVAFRVMDAAGAVAAMRSLGIRGFSVTIPHKEAVIPHLDEIDRTARRMKSVNTIVNENGRLLGYSTDGPGAMKALQAGGIHARGRNVLIVGTGGAARAVAFSLLDEGVRAIMFRSVVKEQEKALAAELDAEQPGVVDGELIPDILINASPIGMSPHVDELPVEEELLRPELAVFDVVYNPEETKLLRIAKSKGCRTVNGVGMFAEQAALQFELFTGKPAPRELMYRTVREALRKK